MYTVLGFDWLLLFLGSNVHKTSVIRGVRILFKILKHPEALNTFHSGISNGSWLQGYDAITTSKSNVAAGNISFMISTDLVFVL